MKNIVACVSAGQCTLYQKTDVRYRPIIEFSISTQERSPTVVMKTIVVGQ